MKQFLQIACEPCILQNALRIALVVGTILNAINQAPAIIAGAGIAWSHLLLNFFVPYCVATYSAVKNESRRRGK